MKKVIGLLILGLLCFRFVQAMEPMAVQEHTKAAAAATDVDSVTTNRMTDNIKSNTAVAVPQGSRAQENLSLLQEQIDLLQNQNRRLLKTSERQWFISGAGVLLLGIFLGVVISRGGRRRVTEWR